MDNQQFIDLCVDKLTDRGINKSKIFTVWSCKTLQNNKAIMSYSTTDKFAPLYEFTHNGDKNEIYMDVYHRHENVTFSV